MSRCRSSAATRDAGANPLRSPLLLSRSARGLDFARHERGLCGLLSLRGLCEKLYHRLRIPPSPSGEAKPTGYSTVVDRRCMPPRLGAAGKGSSCPLWIASSALPPRNDEVGVGGFISTSCRRRVTSSARRSRSCEGIGVCGGCMARANRRITPASTASVLAS